MLSEACGKKKKMKMEKKEVEKGEGDEGEEGDLSPSSPSPSSSASLVRLGIGAAPLLAFERWMWECSAATSTSDQGADPVLPRPCAASSSSSSSSNSSLSFEPGLVHSLVRAGADPRDSRTVAALLSAESRRLSAAIAKEARARATRGSGSGGGGGGKDARKEEGSVVSVEVHKHSLDLCASSSNPSSKPSSSSSSAANKEFIKISRPAYCRLLRAFRECGPEGEKPPKLAGAEEKEEAADDAEVAVAASTSTSAPPLRSAFHSRLFAMLLRYKSLAGPGFHASVGGPVCSVLSKTIGTGLEGFASPVNARWSRFGCAFPDVDAVFGGLGSFFVEAKGGEGEGGRRNELSAASKLLLPAGGSVLVNPPFEPKLLLAAARCCVRAVEEASTKGKRLAVVFVGPRWSRSEREGEGGETANDDSGDGCGGGDISGPNAFLSALSSSPCLEHSFTVAAAEHGFRDGAPHAARDPYRRSPFDTAVSLLRSRAEREKKPLGDSDTWEAAIREAFKLCLPSAEAEERQRAARGATDRKGWGTGGEGAEGRKKKTKPSSLRASIEARQRLKAERRKGDSAPRSSLSPSGKRWVKKSKMNGGGKRKGGGGGSGGGGEQATKKQKK